MFKISCATANKPSARGSRSWSLASVAFLNFRPGLSLTFLHQFITAIYQLH